MPRKGEPCETSGDAREETRKVSVHDYEHLEDALRTVLEDRVDRLDGLDLLQLVAHLMAGQVVDAFKQVQVAVGKSHEKDVPENRRPHGLSLRVVLVGAHQDDRVDLAEHQWQEYYGQGDDGPLGMAGLEVETGQTQV